MRRFVVAIAAITLMACREKVTPPQMTGDAALTDSADQVAFDVRMSMTHTGVKRGDLFADTMYVLDSQNRFLLRKVRANFNTELGVPNGNLKGDRGTYDTRTKVLEGLGNVVIVSTKGERLTSQQVRFTEATNQVSSDSAYRLVKQDEIQTGVGFTSDPNLKVFKCKSQCGGSTLDVMKALPKP